MQFSKIANFVGAAGIKSIKCDFVFPYPTPLGIPYYTTNRDGRCDAQPTPSPFAKLLTCDVAFAVCSFDNQLFWNWTDFRHMMCVAIKHPINLSNGTCCDASMPCVVERRVISHHQATFECPQKFPFHLCFNFLLVPCPCLFGLASALWITRVRTDSTRMQIKQIKV